jgi:hypothetical protein
MGHFKGLSLPSGTRKCAKGMVEWYINKLWREVSGLHRSNQISWLDSILICQLLKPIEHSRRFCTGIDGNLCWTFFQSVCEGEGNMRRPGGNYQPVNNQTREDSLLCPFKWGQWGERCEYLDRTVAIESNSPPTQSLEHYESHPQYYAES